MFCNSWTSFEKDKDYGKGAVSICGYFGMNAFGFRCRRRAIVYFLYSTYLNP